MFESAPRGAGRPNPMKAKPASKRANKSQGASVPKSQGKPRRGRAKNQERPIKAKESQGFRECR
jgi:hypothetical protein